MNDQQKWKNAWESFINLTKSYITVDEKIVKFDKETNVQDIYNFCISTIKSVGISMIVHEDYYKLRIYLSNLKKIENFINMEILDDKNLNISLMQMISRNSEKKGLPSYVLETNHLTVLYFKTNDVQLLNNIFNIAIKNKLHHIINKLKIHVDLNLFTNHKCDIDQILKTNSAKILDYLCNINL